MADVIEVGQRARAAAQTLQTASGVVRDRVLLEIADALQAKAAEIAAENAKDLENAKVNNADQALVKRLVLDQQKIGGLVQGLLELQKLPDPLGTIQLDRLLAADLRLKRLACPIGVLCIIFESRPEAVIQIASLALKSGNAVILKGGKEAAHSNTVLVTLIREVLARHSAQVPVDSVQLVSTREEISELLKLDACIDLVIPRGGAALVQSVKAQTRIPVLGHADGICHVYLDQHARAEVAIPVVVDSKTHYPAACNAAEVLLVHTAVLEDVLPGVGRALVQAGVVLHADAATAPVLRAAASCIGRAGSVLDMEPGDESREWLSLHMTVIAVEGIGQAVRHINTHGSHHTDCIVTEDSASAHTFCSGVDSAGVYHNASTRFADGYRYGFGAEVGISTNRVHARGPVGLEGLLTYKYVLASAPGTTHTVAQFSSSAAVEVGGVHLPALTYQHKDLPL